MRILQADSGSDSDSKGWRKECTLFNSAGVYSGGRPWWVSPGSRSQAVYWNDFLILISCSVGHQHAK